MLHTVQTVVINITSTDVINHFLAVEFDSSASTITCVFLNQQDNSGKSCSVVYGLCGENPHLSNQGVPTSTSNSIILQLQFENQTETDFCYSVTASNGTFSAIVVGRFGDVEDGE